MADVRAFVSSDLCTLSDYSYTQGKTISIGFPDWFHSGYYLVGGYGIVRYVTSEKEFSENMDMNIPNDPAMPVEEGEEIAGEMVETVTFRIDREEEVTVRVTFEPENGGEDGYGSIPDPSAKVILPTPVGEIWNQEMARTFAQSEHYIILCPHYEGYDERILSLVDYKISLGKYVLTGGELPALIIIDSVVRLIPGVLGGETSAEIESFSDGDNLEYPQYTRPEDFRGMKVPEVLLSGNHGEIAKWREEHSGKVE